MGRPKLPSLFHIYSEEASVNIVTLYVICNCSHAIDLYKFVIFFSFFCISESETKDSNSQVRYKTNLYPLARSKLLQIFKKVKLANIVLIDFYKVHNIMVVFGNAS